MKKKKQKRHATGEGNKHFKKSVQQQNCTHDKLKTVLENACSCEQTANITQTVPDEFFYNTCECIDCDCHNENGEVEEDFCHCGYMSNPLGLKHSSLSCSCNPSKIFK